jgi:hypothetical protein
MDGRDRRLSLVIRGAWLVACAGLATGAGADAHTDYMLHCQGCHLADGRGAPDAVPDLRGSLGALLAVPGGRAFLVHVPGSRNSPLDDAGLAGVLNWMVRAFATTPVDPFEPYTAGEVARLRAEPPVDVAAQRSALYGAIGAP